MNRSCVAHGCFNETWTTWHCSTDLTKFVCLFVCLNVLPGTWLVLNSDQSVLPEVDINEGAFGLCGLCPEEPSEELNNVVDLTWVILVS